MKIAFAADALSGFKIAKDSTYAMMSEAAARGHEIHAFGHADLIFDGDTVKAAAALVNLTGDAGAWYRAEEPVLQPLTAFDAVIERTDPPFDMQYLYATHLLQRAEAGGARVFNRPRAIRDHNEKLAITGFPQFIAPTLVTSENEPIRAFHRKHRDIILKPLDGMGGMGIFRVGSDGMNLGSIIETLTEDGTRSVMAQRYIPEIVEGDKRVLLIGGQIVPYALARVPQAGEVRGNLAAGGTGIAMPLSDREREIAEALAPELHSRGLLLVGLDVIGHYLTEINVTSPTCFQEIMQQTGFNVAGMFMDALEKAVRESTS
jgi:glutathione synthase